MTTVKKRPQTETSSNDTELKAPPKNGYQQFQIEEIEKRKATNTFDFGASSKEISQQWKELSQQEKLKYEKQSALNTIQFWWKLADWGSETGKTEYVPPKKKKTKKTTNVVDAEAEVEVEEDHMDQDEEEDQVVVPAKKAKSTAQETKAPAKKATGKKRS